MSPDEEYLDDLLNSLVEGEEGDGFLPEDEGAAEDLEFGEGMLPEDLEFAAEDFNMEDLPAEDIDVGDFVSEDLGADDFALDDYLMVWNRIILHWKILGLRIWNPVILYPKI